MAEIPAFQRAYSSEAKAQRAQDLIDAARTLATRDGVRTLTLSVIAQHAGVHVSAVRRYFLSREEILIRLTQEGYEDWAHALVTQLSSRRAISARNWPTSSWRASASDPCSATSSRTAR